MAAQDGTQNVVLKTVLKTVVESKWFGLRSYLRATELVRLPVSFSTYIVGTEATETVSPCQ